MNATATRARPVPEDEIYPRDEENRFRLYAVTGDDHRVLCTGPDMASMGLAIGTFHADQQAIGQRLADLGRIGILDTMPGGKPAPYGDWVLLPFDRMFS